VLKKWSATTKEIRQNINMEIQQQLLPVNNLTGNAALSKTKLQCKLQIENLVVARECPTTNNNRQDEKK
jgi:hypothetical protein